MSPTVFSGKSKLSRITDRELDGTQSSCRFSKARKEHAEREMAAVMKRNINTGVL
jgi:hypothetical protein